MKIIVVHKGFIEIELPKHIDVKGAFLIVQLIYKYFPETSIYIDNGTGAVFIHSMY